MKHTTSPKGLAKIATLSLCLLLLAPTSALLIANLGDEPLDQSAQALLEKAPMTSNTTGAFQTPYPILLGIFAEKGVDAESAGKDYLNAHSKLKFWQVQSCRDGQSPDRDLCIPKLPSAYSPAYRAPSDCQSRTFCKDANAEALAFESATAHIVSRLRSALSFDSIGSASLPIPSGGAALSLHKAWEVQRLFWSIQLAKSAQVSPKDLQETVANTLRDWSRSQHVFSRSLEEPRSAIETSVLTMILDQNRTFLQQMAQQYPSQGEAIRATAESHQLALDAETILENTQAKELLALQTIVDGLKESPEARRRFSMGLSDINADPDEEITANPLERILLQCCLLRNATLNQAVRAMKAPSTEAESTGFPLINPAGFQLTRLYLNFPRTKKQISDKISILNQPVDLN